MTFTVDEGLRIEAVDDGYLVLDPAVDANRVYELHGDQAEAFALARAGTDDVPDELAATMAGLVHLGLVQTNAWTRRRILQLGGVAAAAAVTVIAMPGVAAAASSPGGPGSTTAPATTAPPTTQPAPEQLLSTDLFGTYSVTVPAGRTLSYSLTGAAGGDASYGLYQTSPPGVQTVPASLGQGGSGATVSGTIPPSDTGYTLDVIVGQAGAVTTGATGAGGGGGDASVLSSGSTILIVAPGGGGGGTCTQWGWVGAPSPIGGNGARGGESAVVRSSIATGITGSSLAGGGAGANGAGGAGGGEPGLSWSAGGNGGGGGADAGHSEPPGGAGATPAPETKAFQVGGEDFVSGGGGGGGYGGGGGGAGGDAAIGGGGGGGGGWVAAGSPDGAITGYGGVGNGSVTLTLI